MTTLTIELPPDLGLSEHDAKRLFVSKLYEDGIVSAGRGAEMLGMTYREFIETFGIYCRTTPEELKQDLEVAHSAINPESVRQALERKSAKTKNQTT